MPDYDRLYGPTEAEFNSFTNKTVTTTAEFERQRARAQEVFDAIAGQWVPGDAPEPVEL